MRRETDEERLPVPVLPLVDALPPGLELVLLGPLEPLLGLVGPEDEPPFTK
jgi:hypothetical protein